MKDLNYISTDKLLDNSYYLYHLIHRTQTAYTYDLASRLLTLVTTSPSHKVTRDKLASGILHLESTDNQVSVLSNLVTINSYTYTYDNVGNREDMTDLTGLHDYGYDDLYRLIGATHPTIPTENYTYDPVGNRNPLTYVYDEANRLLEDDNYTYAYDDNGNLISKQNKSTLETTNYTYDVENQLIRIDFPDLTFAEYTYDGIGRRIEKNVNGVITRYIYDNEDIIAEYDGSNTLQANYLHGSVIDEPIKKNR
ncbi:MAG: hypothetical protein V1674_06830 [Candidatus Omnitrophota bacterium]